MLALRVSQANRWSSVGKLLTRLWWICMQQLTPSGGGCHGRPQVEAMSTALHAAPDQALPLQPDLIILREVVCLLVGNYDAAHGLPRGADRHCAHAQHAAVREGFQVLELPMVPAQKYSSSLQSSNAAVLCTCTFACVWCWRLGSPVGLPPILHSNGVLGLQHPGHHAFLIALHLLPDAVRRHLGGTGGQVDAGPLQPSLQAGVLSLRCMHAAAKR